MHSATQHTVNTTLFT